MNRRFRKKRKNSFDNVPINTIFSMVCAIVNIVIMIIITISAVASNGKLNILMGLVGILSAIISGFGLYYAIKGFKEDDNNIMTIPLIGIVLNGLITVFLVALYIVGIFI